jgi:ribosomal protein S6--L-glutamate ligase
MQECVDSGGAAQFFGLQSARPTTFYADLFDAMGKNTFPSYHTYKCVQDKIKQTALFELMSIPHPKTRVFYGKRSQQQIPHYFSFPYIAKIPKGSALGRGVYLIHDDDQLQAYLTQSRIAYIQEYFPIDRDIRIVIIGQRVVHAYWRIAAPHEYRCNVSLGGSICLDPVPREALELAVHTARLCGWDDVGIDICSDGSTYYVLEANMKYGREGFREAGIDYYKLMEEMIENDEI